MSQARDIDYASINATDTQVSEAWQTWALQRKCVNCGVYYKAFDTFGCRGCWQHPGHVVVTKNDNGDYIEEYSCCGAKLPRPVYNDSVVNFCPTTEILDSYMMTTFGNFGTTMKHPRGCVEADHTDVNEPWPSGKIELFDQNNSIDVNLKKYLRPVGGWKINANVMYEGVKVTIRSPPDAFGNIRIEGTPGSSVPTECHVKDLSPTNDWVSNIPTTVEIINEHGRVEDKISKIDGHWVRWSAGVPVSQIAAMIPYMMQGKEDSKFPNREGIQKHITGVPVVWRINPARKNT